MKLQINYPRQAQKFFTRHSSVLTVEEADVLIAKAMKQILRLENTNVDVRALKGNRRGYYRIRTGAVRIIFSYHHGIVIIVTVEAFDFRGQVYK
jgi:mRNA-degrading endonuclease RelE of RelBE toxin-antitoxin system